MTVLVAVVVGVVGLAVGSFLNVVVWRVPRGESVVRPGSHCPRCNVELSWRDNIPVFSWIVLRGRCRHCAEPISRRYPLVESATGLLFVLAALWFGPHAILPAYLYLAAIAVALTLIDLDVQRLPDAITLPSYPVLLALFLIPAVVSAADGSYVRAVVGMAALFVFYAVVWFVYPVGMGLGDVKLAGIVGLSLAWLGWGQLVVGAFAAFVVGAVVSVALVAMSGAGRKTRVPFGPFMLLGVVIGVVAGHPVAHAYTHAFNV